MLLEIRNEKSQALMYQMITNPMSIILNKKCTHISTDKKKVNKKKKWLKDFTS